ncbi:NACHT domain-containing protein [Psychrobacter sp. N25K4-3-2]|uniref:NACHT domain-containing protein n=1 Tax=Psychrobacter sp. N25K4-3-2 TaxID=2785026 RepID=UPI00188D59A3|nr:NACHT domain-containing protein [Psychrobacter sp. N25K4-3-2]MBF4490458.1 NACHT domain-containing protein [Psychrobacter sp. N25K4-3-2]
MVVTAAVLATLLKDPLTKALGWTFSEALKGSRNQKIEKSLESLSKRITDVIKVKTIYQGAKSINLNEFYVPTRVNDVETRIEHILNIDVSSIVLEGTVGQGKSIFMRYLTYQEARQGNRVPIFFELRRLEDNQSLEEAISLTINNWIESFSNENFVKIAESGNLILFLDGFDELPHEKVKTLLNEIEGWCERYPNMQLIISARPESEIQKSNYFKVYRLSSYRFHEQSKLVDKLVDDEKSREILKKTIKESTHEIQDLLTTPLMVTLFVMTYRALSEIPESQSDFYKSLFSVLTSRHDKTKPGYKRQLSSNLNEAQLQSVFEEFCFFTGNSNKLILDYPEAIEIIKKCLHNQKISDNPTNILEDFSKVVCLLLKDGLNYSFVHRSIQEYFYASFISKKSERAQQKFYLEYSKNIHLFFKAKGAVRFLEETSRYNYYKYFRLPIIEEYVGYYEISRNSNTLINNLLINKISKSEIEVILDDKGKIQSEFFCAPLEISNFLQKYIFSFMFENNANLSRFSSAKVNTEDMDKHRFKIEDFEKIEYNLGSFELVKLKEEILKLSNKIISNREEIIKYINQQDDIDINIDVSDII